MVNLFLYQNNDNIIYKINLTLETHFFIPFPTWSYFQTLLYIRVEEQPQWLTQQPPEADYLADYQSD